MVSDLPLPTVITVLSFRATAVSIIFAVPPVTLTATPTPELSKVNVLPLFAITKELLLFIVIRPTVSLASKVTVRRAEPVPNVAESPAA
jgi:hypothetical protein